MTKKELNNVVSIVEEQLTNNAKGFTVDFNSAKAGVLVNSFSAGYAVSITNNVFNYSDTSSILKAVKKVMTVALAVSSDILCGGWIDKETNQFYLDASILVMDKAQAIAIGKAFNQLAIFDFGNLETITL